METAMPRPTHSRLEILDANGKVVGIIIGPIDAQGLGPGREKVYLARRAPKRSTGDRAA